jgi:hypothetical protein
MKARVLKPNSISRANMNLIGGASLLICQPEGLRPSYYSFSKYVVHDSVVATSIDGINMLYSSTHISNEQ